MTMYLINDYYLFYSLEGAQKYFASIGKEITSVQSL
jgi:hypothetical protein